MFESFEILPLEYEPRPFADTGRLAAQQDRDRAQRNETGLADYQHRRLEYVATTINGAN